MQLEGLRDLAKGNAKKLVQMDSAFREMREGLLKIEDVRSELDRYEADLMKQEASDTESLVERFEVQLAQVRLFTSQKDWRRVFRGSVPAAPKRLRFSSARLSSPPECPAYHLASHRLVVFVGLLARQLHEKSQETLYESIRHCLGEVAPVKAEMEAKMAKLELQHHNLTDQVWGSETAIAKTSGELKNVHLRFDALSQVVKGLTDEKDCREKLEAMQREIADWLNEARFEAEKTRQAFSASTTSSKESIRIGSAEAGAKMANFMDDMRAENQKMVSDSERLRKETVAICDTFRSEMDEMHLHRQRSDEQNQAIHRELREALNDSEKKRKKDKASLEVEMKEVGKQLSILHDFVEEAVEACKNVEPLCSCLVEALAMQFADWARVNLVGYKPVSNGKPEAPRQSSDCPPQATKHKRASPRCQKEEPSQVISLDKRCYSCCSQTQMVMSGFKMACLNYRPSAVHIGEGLDVAVLVFAKNASYERLELFDRMDELLANARERMKYTRARESEVIAFCSGLDLDLPPPPDRRTSQELRAPLPRTGQAKPTFVLPALSAR
eukprot:g28110.t1